MQSNCDYEGEYRLRVTLAPSAALQMESEGNDSIANADIPVLAAVPVSGLVHQRASIAAALATGDGGDFYSLGTLTAGTAITLNESQPATSGLSGVLAILDSAGKAVATSAAGATNLGYTLPTGSDGKYYARVTAAAGTAGLLSQYVLGVDVVDTVPPTVVAVSLPAEGTTASDVLDRFTVTFSKDMAPATVNDGTKVDLRGAGVDGQFDTADDLVYQLVSYGYTRLNSQVFPTSSVQYKKGRRPKEPTLLPEGITGGHEQCETRCVNWRGFWYC